MEGVGHSAIGGRRSAEDGIGAGRLHPRGRTGGPSLPTTQSGWRGRGKKHGGSVWKVQQKDGSW
jgi:hypothetical protein